MNIGDAYEHMTFQKTINTINTDYFPPTFPRHWHKYVELIHLPDTANNKQLPLFNIQETNYRLSPGDLLFIWPGELHEILENPHREVVGLQFAHTLLLELPDFTPYLGLFRTLHHLRAEEYSGLVPSLTAHLTHLLSLQQENSSFCSIEMRITLYEMLIELGRFVDDEWNFSSKQIQNTSNYEKINEACRFIIENCAHDITLNTISGRMGFSPCYFSRTFKGVTGTSFLEYLSSQRIKRAETLLSDFQLSMTEVCYRSGFRSISTFNRIFRAEKGCSPSEYRRYYLEEHAVNL